MMMNNTSNDRQSSSLGLANGIVLGKQLRILFQYLEREDEGALELAKEALKDCERRHFAHDSKFDTLTDEINERVRSAVGEMYWDRACEQVQRQRTVDCQEGINNKSSYSTSRVVAPNNVSQRGSSPSRVGAMDASGVVKSHHQTLREVSQNNPPKQTHRIVRMERTSRRRRSSSTSSSSSR